MKALPTLFAALLLAFALNPAHAQDKKNPAASAPAYPSDPSEMTEQQIKSGDVPAGLNKLAQFYNDNGDYQRFIWTLQRLIELSPNSGTLKLQLAITYAQLDNKSGAYDLLVRMQSQGYGYDLTDDKRFDKIRGTKVWDYIVANLKANLKPFGEGKRAFDIDAKDSLIENLVYDPKRKQFIAGSMREGVISLATMDGKLTPFITPNANNGLWSVYDLGIDSAHDALYVASSSVVQFKNYKPEDAGKAGVFKFQLSTGKFIGKYLVPGEGRHILSTLVVGKDGKVFAADGVANEIYKLDAAGLKLVMRNPKLESVRGMALSPDGKILYFADYSLGIFGIDLAKGSGFEVKHNAEKLALGGIDGLYYYDGNLIMISNGMSPARVMRLKLSPDGRGITGALPLDAAQPAFTAPTYGAIVDDHLFFIANSQKSQYDQYGLPLDATKLQPVHVFKSDLRFAWGQSGVGADMNAIPVASPTEASKYLKAPPKPGLSKPAEQPGKPAEQH